jgi:hypothetical protein
MVTWFALLQGVNIMMTGHTTMANEGGRWYSLELPWRTRDGRKMYADWVAPGEFKDMLKVVRGVFHPEDIYHFASAKAGPFVRIGAQIVTGTDWYGNKLFKPGMPWEDKVKAMTEIAVLNSVPIPFWAQAMWHTVRGRLDPTQLVSSVSGLGPIQRGTAVPASLFKTLPRTKRQEFLNSIPESEREGFLRGLAKGRITTGADRLREFVDDFHYHRNKLDQEIRDRIERGDVAGAIQLMREQQRYRTSRGEQQVIKEYSSGE